jgi:hypothetical protein
MPFKKGQSGNTNGRPKGKSNKVTAKVRDSFSDLLDDNLLQLREDIAELEPKDRVKLLLDLAKYVIPQLKSTEHKLDEDTSAVFNMSVKSFFKVDETK